MAVIDANGFKFLDGLSNDYIVLESSRISDYIRYINQNKIEAIYLSNLYYFNNNLDFLKECEFVKKINITSSSIADYSGLGYLKDLKVLLLDEPKGKVDLSDSEFLEELSIEMNKNIIGIDKLQNLRVLSLWKYKPKSKDLSELSVLKSIEELKVTQSTIESLNGCGDLEKLEKVELNYLSRLEYIDEIDKNKMTLKSLRFTSCKKIKNHDFVTCLSNLETLAFDECGEIDNINFIKKLPNLKNFIFMNTNIVSGDLSPCIGLDYVAFLDRKHYSHKNKELYLIK